MSQFEDLKMKKVIYSYLIVIVCVVMSGCLNASALTREQVISKRDLNRQFLTSKFDFKKNPYSGYTRAHWLEITEKIVAGALSHFDSITGMPDLPGAAGDEAYEKVRMKAPEETPKRSMERIMMAVIIYTKATGKDEVPGYHGSISSPFIKAIIRGTDPQSPGYWGEPLPNDQVGAIFAMAAYIEPERYWDPLTVVQKNKLLSYFKKLAFNKTYNNNHYFFHMIPAELLDRSGVDSNREHLTRMYERLFGWYRGDGWFLDGNNRGFDYYNLWGFQLFNQVLYKYDARWRLQFGDRIKTTTAKFLETFPYLFGRDGGPVPWGRSLSYRFAGNSAIAWAVINKLSTIPPGQARRIASGSLKYFWEHGCLGDDNLLTIGYWGANAAVAENYLYYGDPYWAAQGLACMLIPENDPFWTSVEQPVPADGIGGTIAVEAAQLSIRVSPVDGEVRLFPAGQPWAQERNKWQTGAKYDQHAYSSYLGFCVLGEDGADIGAGRTGYSYDGIKWFYRERAKPIQISTNHLISRYTLKPEGESELIPEDNRDEIITHTLIGKDGEVHIFWHNYPEPVYLYLGGYGISLPFNKSLDTLVQKNEILIHGGDYYSVIQAVKVPNGKFESTVFHPREGWNHTHLFGGQGAFPFWHSDLPVQPNVPLIFYVNGTRNRKPVENSVEVVKNGSVLKIRFEGKWESMHIPF